MHVRAAKGAGSTATEIAVENDIILNLEAYS
jgi:hypothetical protein